MDDPNRTKPITPKVGMVGVSLGIVFRVVTVPYYYSLSPAAMGVYSLVKAVGTENLVKVVSCGGGLVISVV